MENKEIKTKKVKVIPLEVSSIKSGTSSKNGRTFKWKLYKVVCKVLPKEQKIEMTGFDELEPGKETEVEIYQETYRDKKQWEYRTPRRNIWQELDILKERVEKLEDWKSEMAFEKLDKKDFEKEEVPEIDIDDLGDEADETDESEIDAESIF